MKIEFKKITNKPKPIQFALTAENSQDMQEGERIELCGEIVRQSQRLVCFQGVLKGALNLVCTMSGQDFTKEIHEELVLYFSDGIWEAQSQSKDIDSLDIIEFFDGFIDFDFVVTSEIESIRLDYNVKE